MPRKRPTPKPVEDTRAELYARALLTTTDRYLTGCMSHASWIEHMTSLWGTVRARGLTRDVLARVDPKSAAASRFTTIAERRGE